MSLRCRIDIGLMGTMDHKDLVSFYESSSRFAAAGWRVDWYEDVTKLADEVQEFSAMIPPYEFYEKFYHVVDLGLLLLETFRGETPVKSVKLHMHNSIVPSYQIQAHHEYVCGTTAQVFSEAWNHIRSVTSMLRNVVRALGLSPTIDTWTVRFKSDNGSGDICLRETLKTTSDLITTVFGDEVPNIDSASIINSDLWVIKLLKETSEQYLIISFGEEHDFAVSRLYYLMIAEAKAKELLKQLRIEYMKRWEPLQIEASNLPAIDRIRPSTVKDLLVLRTRIQEGAKEFAVIQSHVELVKGFLGFHLGSLLEHTAEDPLIRNAPGVIQALRAHVQLFYMSPLEQLVTRSANIIRELMDSISNVSEVYTTYVNLRGHVLIERLEIVAVGIALLSVAISILALFK